MIANCIEKSGKKSTSKKCIEGECIFPFNYKGKEVNECIKGLKGHWCATKLKASKEMDKFGYCDMSQRKSKSPNNRTQLKNKSKVKTVNTIQNTSKMNTTRNKAKKNIAANKINNTKVTSSKVENDSIYGICRDNTGKTELSIKCKAGKCIFPFKYKSVLTNKCVESKKGDWCATSLSPRNAFKTYAYCHKNLDLNQGLNAKQITKQINKKPTKLKISAPVQTRTVVKMKSDKPHPKFYNMTALDDRVVINYGASDAFGKWWSKRAEIKTESMEETIENIRERIEKYLMKGYYVVSSNLPAEEFKKSNTPSAKSENESKIREKLKSFIQKKMRLGSVMLAEKFYDPNVDRIYQNKKESPKYAYFKYNGDSGKKVKGNWVFTQKPTIYSNDPTGMYMSEKFDGVRAIWDGTNFISRGNQIYNAPEWFTHCLPKDTVLDGELHMGRGNFVKASGAARQKKPSNEKWKNMKFNVFDIPNPQTVLLPFKERIKLFEKVVSECNSRWSSDNLPSNVNKSLSCPIEASNQILVKNMDHAYQYYKDVIINGAEGLILRDANSSYQFNRSINYLKWKPVLDGEAIVSGYKEGWGSLKGYLGAYYAYLIDDKGEKISRSFTMSGHLSKQMRMQYTFDKGKIISTPEKGGELPLIGDKVTMTYMELDDYGLPRFPIFQRIRRD